MRSITSQTINTMVTLMIFILEEANLQWNQLSGACSHILYWIDSPTFFHPPVLFLSPRLHFSLPQVCPCFKVFLSHNSFPVFLTSHQVSPPLKPHPTLTAPVAVQELEAGLSFVTSVSSVASSAAFSYAVSSIDMFLFSLNTISVWNLES